MLSGELSFLFNKPTIERNQLRAKEPGGGHSDITKIALEGLSETIKALPERISAETVKGTIMPLADAEEKKWKSGRGAVLWPLRYALSGQERSPDPFTLISILGKEETISRIQKAIAILKE
jgi:glutamyl/glutaminyl-tRNA synthetase